MNWRAMLLSGVLATGVGMTMVPRASADPPPWAGKWKHHERTWDGDDHWQRGHWNRQDRDHEWRRGRHYRDWARESDRPHWDGHRHGDSPYYYGGYRYDRRNDPNYAKLMDRMRYDRAKIAEIEPTGRHRKALQWYKDDLRNARDLRNDYYARR